MAITPKPLDEAPVGGAYVVNEVVVDANGTPLVGWTIDTKGRIQPPKASPPTEMDGTGEPTS